MIKLTDNSLIVVTGAAQGNGQAIADTVEKAGARVVRIDLLSLSENENNFTGSVESDDLIEEVVRYCEEQQYQTLSLINNAGITLPHEYPYPLDSWEKTLSVNLSAPFKWIEAFVPLLKSADNASVVNITSLGAELAFPNNPAYIASKGGLKMLTKFYAKSLGRYGVRVNNIGPGYIKTDMTSTSYSNKDIKLQREKHTFLKRWGEPSDIADACLFLCSEESKYITGQDIYVDGGWTSNGLIE